MSGNLVLDWPYGTLQTATNLPGNWYNVIGATSPFTQTPVNQQQFYRVQLQ